MHILFITRGYPSEAYKTLGIFEYDMAKALVNAGHQVTYMAVDMRSLRRKRKWGIESFDRDGIHIEGLNIPLGRIYNPLKTKISEILVKYRYRKLVSEGRKFDVIHAHYIGSAYLGAKLKEYSELPLVITEHSSKLNNGVSKYIYKKLTYAYAKADLLTTVSHSLSEVIEEKYGLKSEVIPNIVDTDIFSVNERIETPEVFTFVSTGNLIPGKGMDITIKAFSKLYEFHPNSRLLIFGAGPDREKLTQLAHKEVPKGKVLFMGLVSREELNDQYAVSQCFVLSSFSETFGVAYVEALSKGLPVIATDCGGPSEFVHEANGLIVPIKDVESVFQAMIHMVEHYDRYDSQVISHEIRSRYSPENNASALQEIYGKIVRLH